MPWKVSLPVASFCPTDGSTHRKLTDKHTDYLVLSVARQKADNGEEVPGQLFAAAPTGCYPRTSRRALPAVPGRHARSHSKFAVERQAMVESLSEVALATSDDSKMVRLDLAPQQARLSARRLVWVNLPQCCQPSSWAAAMR